MTSRCFHIRTEACVNSTYLCGDSAVALWADGLDADHLIPGSLSSPAMARRLPVSSCAALLNPREPVMDLVDLSQQCLQLISIQRQDYRIGPQLSQPGSVCSGQS